MFALNVQRFLFVAAQAHVQTMQLADGGSDYVPRMLPYLALQEHVLLLVGRPTNSGAEGAPAVDGIGININIGIGCSLSVSVFATF